MFEIFKPYSINRYDSIGFEVKFSLLSNMLHFSLGNTWRNYSLKTLSVNL